MTARSLFSSTLRPAALVGVFAGGLFAGASPLFAQQVAAVPASPEVFSLTERANIPDVDSKSQVYSVTRQVNYADLDLSKPSAAAELEKRIKQAAMMACRDLSYTYPDRLYPPTSLHQDCVGIATDRAMTAAKAIITAAAAKPALAAAATK